MGSSKLLITVLGLTAFSQLIFEVSAADNISYIGAVVEYYPVRSGTNATTITNENAKNYVTIIKKAWEYNTDIIVFPESSLTSGQGAPKVTWTSFVPDPNTDTPCNNASTVVIEALRLISCTAKTYSMYVVVNLSEKEDCTKTGTSFRPCPKDGYFFYNTNVVFNRTGGIISRYRKFNLFGEDGFNVTAKPEVATFTTDFNVTFGHIICFDILFKTPTLTLITDYNATDILFSVHWFSELPYLTAVQTQSAFSYANNVNLLGAGYNTPATGSGGSGIYLGTNGNLVKLWSETATNTLMVGRVPKLIKGVRSYIASTTYPITYKFTDTEISTLINITNVPQQFMKRDGLEPYNTTILTLNNGTTTTSLEFCDRQFCCSFYINRTFNAQIVNSNVRYYRYRIAVFNGVRTHSGVTTTGSQICSIIPCTNDTLTSCGRRFDATATIVQPTTFNNILISANYSTNNTSQLPDSLTMNILPLNASEFTFTRTNISGSSLVTVTYNLTTKINNLLTFAIYGRNFNSDGLAETLASNVHSSAIQFSSFSIVTSVTVAIAVTLLVTIKQ